MELGILGYTTHARERIRERVGADREHAFLSTVANDTSASLELFRGVLPKQVSRKNGKSIVKNTSKKDLHVLVKFEKNFYVLIMSEIDNTVITVLSERDYRCKGWAVNLSPFIDQMNGVSPSTEEVEPSAGVKGTCSLCQGEYNLSRDLMEEYLSGKDALVLVDGFVYRVCFPGAMKAFDLHRRGSGATLVRGILKVMGSLIRNCTSEYIDMITCEGDMHHISARAFKNITL